MWIVLGEESGKIKLVSKSTVSGLLPKGSFITIDDKGKKFILRVDKSTQNVPYSPEPMIIDMDLSPLIQDQKCQNLVTAYRVKDISERNDGLIDYIHPQSIARRSTQAEIDAALEASENRIGPKVFLATVHGNDNKILTNEKGNYVTTTLPVSMFFHQMLICGKTGSGKTVATKYLTQYFAEEYEGAVLAINVKDVDLLKMDRASETKNPQLMREWSQLGQKAHGIENYVIYYPSNVNLNSSQDISEAVCQKITLDINQIDPESLIGLLQGITDTAAQHLPNIFRYWREHKKPNEKFRDFVIYFSNADEEREFNVLNSRGESPPPVTLFRSTYDHIKQKLNAAMLFFDDESANSITYQDILVRGKVSIINVAGSGFQFGAVLLRQLLHEIVNAKSEQQSTVPVLIVIDEVHRFYDSTSSEDALGDLDTICRTGRSQEIGVIFSSQNPSDIPSGLSSVINTKIFFKSDALSAKSHGIVISSEEMESLKKGYATASIHDLPQVKIVKFPLSYAGVVDR